MVKEQHCPICLFHYGLISKEEFESHRIKKEKHSETFTSVEKDIKDCPCCDCELKRIRIKQEEMR